MHNRVVCKQTQHQRTLSLVMSLVIHRVRLQKKKTCKKLR
jgi:hypothetical protein